MRVGVKQGARVIVVQGGVKEGFCGDVGDTPLVKLLCLPVCDSNYYMVHVPNVSESLSVPRGGPWLGAACAL